MVGGRVDVGKLFVYLGLRCELREAVVRGGLWGVGGIFVK